MSNELRYTVMGGVAGEARPAFANADETQINIDVYFDHLDEVVRYTASQSDPGWPHSEEIYRRAAAGEFGPVAPFSEPDELKWARIRRERDRLLASTDWTQLQDVPQETRLAWQEYRQRLRDIPGAFETPDGVEFPGAPGVGGREDKTETPPVKWARFMGALRQSAVFEAVRRGSRQDVAMNALATELRVALGEAAAGVDNTAVIQELLGSLWPGLSGEQRLEIVTIVAESGVPLTAPELPVGA